MTRHTKSERGTSAPRLDGNPAGAGMGVLADRIAASLLAAGATEIILDRGSTAGQILPTPRVARPDVARVRRARPA